MYPNLVTWEVQEALEVAAPRRCGLVIIMYDAVIGLQNNNLDARWRPNTLPLACGLRLRVVSIASGSGPKISDGLNT